jgi:hypothetical protein
LEKYTKVQGNNFQLKSVFKVALRFCEKSKLSILTWNSTIFLLWTFLIYSMGITTIPQKKKVLKGSLVGRTHIGKEEKR